MRAAAGGVVLDVVWCVFVSSSVFPGSMIFVHSLFVRASVRDVV